MRTQARKMPFTEEQMQQIYNTNLIDFAVQNSFEIEKGDRNTVHVKYSGGLYLFRYGRAMYAFPRKAPKGIMTEAVKQISGYAFDKRDIIRIYAEPFAYNAASCHVFEKAGFQ